MHAIFWIGLVFLTVLVLAKSIQLLESNSNSRLSRTAEITAVFLVLLPLALTWLEHL